MLLSRNSGCKITIFYLFSQTFSLICCSFYGFLCNFAQEMSKNEISILLPVYNEACVDIVRRLAAMCENERARRPDFTYEILVADDASPCVSSIEQNRQINTIPHCTFIEKERNTGSAATRNFLAQKSQYQWLLFLDCDMQIVSQDFLARYLDCASDGVVNGGICIKEGDTQNLRCLYETHCAPMHHYTKRSERPYQSFRSTNFMIERSLMISHPFDERFKKSGYEDVMFGKTLKEHRIRITHIDNPTMMVDFESNACYVEKIERSLRTLYSFRDELRGYSRMLTIVNGIHIKQVLTLIRCWHRLFGALERRILCGKHPVLAVFNLYRLGYYISLTKND